MGTGSVGSFAGSGIIADGGLSIAGRLALCPKSVTQLGVGLWQVVGAGVGFASPAAAAAAPAGLAGEVCILLRGGLANYAVAFAYNPAAPWLCPGAAVAASAAGAGALTAAAGSLAEWVVIENVKAPAGALVDGAAIALACAGGALVLAGVFAAV